MPLPWCASKSQIATRPDAVLQRVQCRDCDVVEVAKAHRPIPGSVVARRPHQTEGALAADRGASDFHCRARRARGVSECFRIGGRVGIEILSRGRDASQVIPRVRAEQHLLRRFLWSAPFEFGMTLLQHRNAVCDSFRTLYMPGSRVFDRTRIVKDQHGRSGVLPCHPIIKPDREDNHRDDQKQVKQCAGHGEKNARHDPENDQDDGEPDECVHM